MLLPLAIMVVERPGPRTTEAWVRITNTGNKPIRILALLVIPKGSIVLVPNRETTFRAASIEPNSEGMTKIIISDVRNSELISEVQLSWKRGHEISFGHTEEDPILILVNGSRSYLASESPFFVIKVLNASSDSSS